MWLVGEETRPSKNMGMYAIFNIHGGFPPNAASCHFDIALPGQDKHAGGEELMADGLNRHAAVGTLRLLPASVQTLGELRPKMI